MKELTEYTNLVSQISLLIRQGQEQIGRVVNQAMTLSYWQIGKYIVDFEQDGKTRASYGKELLQHLSAELTAEFGKGFSYRSLRLFRQFYLTFQNWQTPIANSEQNIWQTLSAKSTVSHLTAQLSWSHFVRLMSVKQIEERSYYLQEAFENRWSVRELDRQVNSSLFERQMLSSKQLPTLKNTEEHGIDEILKDPYVLEFLGIEESTGFSETELETAIINNLEKFLLELGKGFSFVARQKRISSGSDHFYIDLVFYNRLLRSHVLIDLKIGKLKHQDIGQMQMYVNYFDREIKTEYENRTVGIILCKEKNDFVIEYSLPKENNQVFAKEYKLYLPDKAKLKSILKKYI